MIKILYGRIVGNEFKTTESYKFGGDWEKAYRGAVERNCDIKFLGGGLNLCLTNQQVHDIISDVDRIMQNDS
jgi:hypothetical protein